MKKIVISFLVGASLMFSLQSYAEDGLEKVSAYLRPSLPITLDGNPITLQNAPVMYEGSTFLNLRDLAKISGLGVNWNEATQTVELATYGYKPPTPVETPTPPVVEVDTQVYYSFKEYGAKNDYALTSTVRNNKLIVIHNGKEYEADRNKNYFYDLKDDNTYYSESFFLQFLTNEDLFGLTRYTVDRKVRTVSIIN